MLAVGVDVASRPDRKPRTRSPVQRRPPPRGGPSAGAARYPESAPDSWVGITKEPLRGPGMPTQLSSPPRPVASQRHGAGASALATARSVPDGRNSSALAVAARSMRGGASDSAAGSGLTDRRQPRPGGATTVPQLELEAGHRRSVARDGLAVATCSRRRHPGEEGVELVEEQLPGRLVGARGCGCDSATARAGCRGSGPPARVRTPAARAARRECSSSVGHETSGATSVTSMSPKISMKRTAFSGDVVRRCNSLNAAHCSSVPSGMNCDVNTWRNAGSSLPHPTRASSRCRAASALLLGRRAPTGRGRHAPHRTSAETRSGWRTA